MNSVWRDKKKNRSSHKKSDRMTISDLWIKIKNYNFNSKYAVDGYMDFRLNIACGNVKNIAVSTYIIYYRRKMQMVIIFSVCNPLDT